MDQKQIIVHIGQAKAGSSTLQTSLRAAQPRLKAHGVGVVTIGPALLGTIAGRYWRDYEDRELQKISNSIQNLDNDSQIKKIILSSEFIFRGSPNKILNYLRRWSTDISVILYVRDPSQRYMSSQQQRLKKKHKFRNPLLWLEQYEKIQEWQKCFAPHFHILPFQSRTWDKQGLLSHFVESFADLKPHSINEFPTLRSNTSEFSEVTSVLQQFFWSFRDERDNNLKSDADRLRHSLQDLCVREGIGTRATCREHVRKTVLAANKTQLMTLADLYGITFDSIDYQEIESLSVDQSLSEVRWFSDISELDKNIEDYITMKAIRDYMSPRHKDHILIRMRDRISELFPAHMRKVSVVKGLRGLFGS